MTTCAYAMEWIDGKTLAQAIDHLAQLAHEPSLDDLRRHLDPTRSPAAGGNLVVFFCQLGIQIARALEAVHHARLLHRDLKPSNILLRKDGTALLSDFGLVREALGPTHTLSGEFLGTPAYAAPEQLRGDRQALDARTDVYALGVTLYHTLALRLPYQGRSSAELLSAIERGHHPPLRRVRPAVSKDLDTIVATAMDPEPRRRYASAAAFADDLERLLSLRPITARPPSLLVRTLKLGRRHARILLATAVTAILVLALVVPLMRDQELRRQREKDLPQLVASEVRKARLALLSSDYGDRAFASAAGLASAAQPLADGTTQAALHHYDAAVALDPTRDDVRCEREVVVLSRAIHAGTARSPTSALARVAPLTCEIARAWTDVNRPPAVSDQTLRAATPIDRRYLGLLAYLCSAAELCPRAWAPLDTQLADGDPLVAGALGELYLQTDRAALAYARLLRAAVAFPEAGFLAVDLADAANRAGDHVPARAYLEQGRAAGGLDRYETDVHIEADILAAEGNVAAARLLYEWMVTHHQAPTAHYHYALFLEREGDWQRVFEIYDKLVRAYPTVESYRLAFVRAFRAPLRASRLGDRIAFMMAVLEADPKLRGSIATVEKSPTVASSTSSSVRDEASPWSFAFTLEVMTMSQDVLWRLPRPLKQLLAGAAVVLDAGSEKLGRWAPMLAKGLRLSVERLSPKPCS
ncbi:MAG: serine/threonine-protein kinase [Planctomycetota bacterium]